MWHGGELRPPRALAVQARRGVQVSTGTVRRWRQEPGWVGKRAPLAATAEDPQRVAQLARMRCGFEPVPAKAALCFADELAIHLLPTVGYPWRPKGEQVAGRTPGTTEKRSLAGALEMPRGRIGQRVWWRKTPGLFLDLLPARARPYPASRLSCL